MLCEADVNYASEQKVYPTYDFANALQMQGGSMVQSAEKRHSGPAGEGHAGVNTAGEKEVDPIYEFIPALQMQGGSLVQSAEKLHYTAGKKGDAGRMEDNSVLLPALEVEGGLYIKMARTKQSSNHGNDEQEEGYIFISALTIQGLNEIQTAQRIGKNNEQNADARIASQQHTIAHAGVRQDSVSNAQIRRQEVSESQGARAAQLEAIAQADFIHSQAVSRAEIYRQETGRSSAVVGALSSRTQGIDSRAGHAPEDASSIWMSDTLRSTEDDMAQEELYVKTVNWGNGESRPSFTEEDFGFQCSDNPGLEKNVEEINDGILNFAGLGALAGLLEDFGHISTLDDLTASGLIKQRQSNWPELSAKGKTSRKLDFSKNTRQQETDEKADCEGTAEESGTGLKRKVSRLLSRISHTDKEEESIVEDQPDWADLSTNGRASRQPIARQSHTEEVVEETRQYDSNDDNEEDIGVADWSKVEKRPSFAFVSVLEDISQNGLN